MYLFESLSTPKKSSSVFQQIIDRIESGEFPPNSKLPNELDLAHSLGVSRTVIREALSALEILELVERRVGNGTYVKPLSDKHKYEDLRFTNKPIILNYLKKIEASGGSYSAFEARNLMEPWLAGVVAVRAEDADLVKLRQICKRMEKSLEDGDRESFRHSDVDFHCYIARTCKNEFLEKFLLEAIDAEKFVLWRSEMDWPTPKRMRKSVKEHLDVADAIFKGDFEGATKSMERHFTFHWSEIARILGVDLSLQDKKDAL